MLALSLRQPWAALVIGGRKSIEIRKWWTNVRGPILIHASSVPDARAEAWAWIEPPIAPLSHLYGGIIGTATLDDVVKYTNQELFAAQVDRHRNYPDWFQAPAMYGFVFIQPQMVPFRRYKGDVKFFEVTEAK